MKYPNRTFVGFYKIKAGKVAELLFRPNITIPKSPVVKGTYVPTDDENDLMDMRARIMFAVADNAFSPILETLNTSEIGDAFDDLLIEAVLATTDNDKKIGLKVGLAIADSGDNTGKGVITFSYRDSGVTTTTEVVIDIVDPG